MRKMVKSEDFEKARLLELIATDKNEEMVKYEDFEEAGLEMCTAEKIEEIVNMIILKMPG